MSVSPCFNVSRRVVTRALLLASFFFALLETTAWIVPPSESIGYFGFRRAGENVVKHQDFAMHQAYLRSIAAHRVAHPYRISEQAILSHQQFPFLQKSLLHGYSPVTLLLEWPFLRFSPEVLYFAFSALNFAAVAWLWQTFLLPRVENDVHLVSLLLAFLNSEFDAVFSAGQTTFLTTTLLAWGILQLSPGALPQARLRQDLVLAAALLILAIKPNFALVFGLICVAERRWRPIGFALLGLLLIWVWAYPFYGGWWQGLIDYSRLLSGYDPLRAPAYFQDSFVLRNTIFSSLYESLNPKLDHAGYSVLRYVFLALLATWSVLRWRGLAQRIFISGMLWTLLLFCPYFAVYEDWLLVLVVALSRFYGQKRLAFCFWTILIVLLDYTDGTISGASGFALKLLLFLGWLKFEVDQGEFWPRAKEAGPKNPRDPVPQAA